MFRRGKNMATVKFPNKKTLTISKLENKIKVVPYLKSNEKAIILNMMLAEENPIEARNLLDSLVLQTHVEGLILNSNEEDTDSVEIEVLDALRASKTLTEVYQKSGLDVYVDELWEMYLNSREADALVELKNNIVNTLNEIKKEFASFDKDKLLLELATQVETFDKAKIHLNETINNPKDDKGNIIRLKEADK
jgi:hypothetical protein